VGVKVAPVEVEDLEDPAVALAIFFEPPVEVLICSNVWKSSVAMVVAVPHT